MTTSTLDSLTTNDAGKREAARLDYIAILKRDLDAKPGDAERLAEVMGILGYTAAEAKADRATLRSVAEHEANLVSPESDAQRATRLKRIETNDAKIKALRKELDETLVQFRNDLDTGDRIGNNINLAKSEIQRHKEANHRRLFPESKPHDFGGQRTINNYGQ